MVAILAVSTTGFTAAELGWTVLMGLAHLVYSIIPAGGLQITVGCIEDLVHCSILIMLTTGIDLRRPFHLGVLLDCSCKMNCYSSHLREDLVREYVNSIAVGAVAMDKGGTEILFTRSLPSSEAPCLVLGR